MANNLMFEAVKVTGAAACAVSEVVGCKDELQADQRAVDAMRCTLNTLPIRGRVVVGEGERDQAPLLGFGEAVGRGWVSGEPGTSSFPEVDIALDPLEGTTLAALGKGNALSVLALAPCGGILQVPDVYMEKVAVGPDVPPETLSLDRSLEHNVQAVARAKDISLSQVRVCILDRVRHKEMIERVRQMGCAVELIQDGDIVGVLNTSWGVGTLQSSGHRIDLYIGIGGAPEGVLAAAALQCLGGWMQGRLLFRNDKEKDRATACGITDLKRVYDLKDLVSGDDVVFCATGVTDGKLLQGVRRTSTHTVAHSLVMSSQERMIHFTETFCSI